MRTARLLVTSALLLLVDCRATVTATGTTSGSAAPAETSTVTVSPAAAGTPPEAHPSRAVCGEQVQVASSGGATCNRHVRLVKLRKISGCYVDVIHESEVGDLRYPCEGGTAEVSFAKVKFTGTVIGGELSMCLGTKFQFGDGCTWNSAQRLTGSIASGRLSLTYAEEPLATQSGCATACSASGDLVIE